MHPSAMKNGQAFFDTYVSRLNQVTVVEIGSQDVNGSLRDVSPSGIRYIGLDFEEAKGVDVLLTDPYTLPFEDNSVDVVVSSSCFEHSEMFWLVFIEVLRILKPDGLFYLNVPSNGAFHQYPVDCWRFYPDAGDALVTWGKHCGYRTALLESYTSPQDADIWNDYVAVFLKDETYISAHPFRIAPQNSTLENSKIWENPAISNKTTVPQDMRRISQLNELLVQEQQNSSQLNELLAIERQNSELKIKELHVAEEQIRQTEVIIAQTHQELTNVLTENVCRTAQIEELKNSRSWKITAPLRAFKDSLRRRKSSSN